MKKDIDEFIEEMIRLGGDNTSSMDFIKTLAYILGSFQLWEDGSLSFKVNAEFFKGVGDHKQERHHKDNERRQKDHPKQDLR